MMECQGFDQLPPHQCELGQRAFARSRKPPGLQLLLQIDGRCPCASREVWVLPARVDGPCASWRELWVPSRLDVPNVSWELWVLLPRVDGPRASWELSLDERLEVLAVLLHLQLPVELELEVPPVLLPAADAGSLVLPAADAASVLLLPVDAAGSVLEVEAEEQLLLLLGGQQDQQLRLQGHYPNKIAG